MDSKPTKRHVMLPIDAEPESPQHARDLQSLHTPESVGELALGVTHEIQNSNYLRRNLRESTRAAFVSDYVEDGSDDRTTRIDDPHLHMPHSVGDVISRVSHKKSDATYIGRTDTEATQAKFIPRYMDDESTGEIGPRRSYGEELVQVLRGVRDKKRASNDKALETEGVRRFGIFMSAEEYELIQEEERTQADLKLWIRFDTLFGLLILLNSIMIALTYDGVLEDDDPAVITASFLFFAAFAFELAFRLWKHPQGLRALLTEKWLVFDFLCLLILVVNFLFFALDQNLWISLRIVRIARSVRILRFVRYLSQMYTLWAGLQNGLLFVAWGLFCYILTTYVFGMLTFSLLEYSDETGQQRWGGVLNSMLTWAQIGTRDDAATILRHALDQDDANSWMILVFVCFLIIGYLWILNILVGMLLTSVETVVTKSDAFESSLAGVKRRMDIRLLHEALKDTYLRSTGENVTGVTRQQLLNIHSHNVRPSLEDDVFQLRKFGDGNRRATFDLPELFKRSGTGVNEINAIFDEIESARGLFGDQNVSLDEFFEGCMWLHDQVRPTDVLAFVSGMMSMQSRLTHLTGMLSDMCQTLNDTKVLVSSYVARYQSPHRLAPEIAVKNPVVNTGQHQHALTRREQELVNDMRYREEVEVLWVRFDSVASFFMVMSVILMFLDVNGDLVGSLLTAVDVSFACIFSFELVLRVVTSYQVEVIHLLSMKLAVWPEFLSRMGDRERSAVLWYLPRILLDPVYVFDIIVVMVHYVLVVMDLFASDDVRQHGAIILLQCFKLLRFLRLVPARHLEPLITGLSQMLQNFFWSGVMLMILTYVVAIIMIQIVGKDESAADDAEMQAHWARIGSAIETLLQICTFSDWTLYINQVQQRNFRAVPVMLGIFAAIAGLAIMNMITGVIVHAAFTVLNLADKREKRLIGLKNTLYETKASIFQHIHSERFTEVKRKLAVPASDGLDLYDDSNFIGTTSISGSTKYFPDESPLADESADAGNRVTLADDTIHDVELEQMVRDKVLQKMLRKTGVRVDQAMIVWQKIDSMSADGVAVDAFLQGIIRMVQPLQGIDVAAMKSHMRRTLHEHAQLTADTTKCQESFMNIFDNLRQVHLTCQVEDGVKHREVRKELLDDTTKERRALLIHRNNTLKRRISVAKQHLEMRRKTLSEIAPRATVLPGRQEEVSPLCSARVGFD